MTPHQALVRILSGTAGRAALRRGLPTYFAVFLVAVALFVGKYAMKASDLTGPARASLGFRAVILAGWLILSLPVARALLTSPSSRFVRVFPVSWTAAAAVMGVGLLLVESPWIILWGAGEGVTGGLGAAVIAAGAHAFVLGRPRRLHEIAAAVPWVGGVMLGPGLPDLLALPALLLGLRLVWIRGAEPGVPRARRWVPRAPAAVALAAGHLASVVRAQRALLARWGWLALGSVGIAMLAIHNNDVVEADGVVTLSLAILAPVMTFGTLTVGGAMLRADHRAAWLLDVSGATSRTRVAGAALALAICGLAFGVVHALFVAQVRGSASLLRLTASAAGEGAALGILSATVARWTDRGSGHDSRRVLLVSCVIALAVVVLVAYLQEVGPLLALVAGIAGVAVAPPPHRSPVVRALIAEDQD